MSSRTPVLFVLHNHQPVGNLPWITDECFRTAYLPFLEVLERHPRLRLGLHFTGPLLEWLEEEQPAYLDRVRLLVAQGQVEVLGGGFYEPILTVIPSQDRIGQLNLMRDNVERLFGQPPVGAWLAERVWEPQLASTLPEAGVQYVLIDDEVFHRLGYQEHETQASFLTEDGGARVRVLPINRCLRYTIPTKTVPEVLDTLRGMAAGGAEVLIYAEDGERYGNWPGTFEFMYGEEAYLETLFSALEEAEDLEFLLPCEYMKRFAPRHLVYLPPTSYTEMLQWSGGFWRNFLVRYRESNLMHKKMQQVSRWVATAQSAGYDVAGAQRHLYAAQCNCAYWYGVFGGLYLPHLRRAVYQHLLQAERVVASLLPAQERPACEIVDHDSDGKDEIFLRNGELSVGITPAWGGAVFALEHLGAAHNFLNTMARYPVTIAGSTDDLPVDWYPRVAFLDHILPADCTPPAIQQPDYGELGDFVVGDYAIVQAAKGTVVLRREGHFKDGPECAPLVIEKRYTIADETLGVHYTLTNPDQQPRTFRFAVEVNASLSAGDAPGRLLVGILPDETTTAHSLEKTTILNAAGGMVYRDDWLGVELRVRWSQASETWAFPVTTPMHSLEGTEWVYQSTVTLPHWDVTLPAGGQWAVEMKVATAVEVAATQASDSKP
ncbi:MAG: alpha-amylase/4-alpha-glucanotransferase domain-containing protein [Armatimonadota bacterium]